MKESKYHLEFGSGAACMEMMTEATKWLVHRDIKWSTKDCFLFYH